MIEPASREFPAVPPAAEATRRATLDGVRETVRAWREPVLTRMLGPVRRVAGPRETGAFGILMYHRVTPRVPGVPTPTWNVTPSRFRAQLAGLLKRGYEAWPLQRVLDYSAAGEPIGRNVFVVTFDDGYENNFVHAWPVLRELSVPATLFLATAYLDDDGPFPSDDWSAAGSDRVPPESWRPLVQSQCAEMHEHGLVELAAHTHTHDDFRGRPEALARDLAENLAALESRFGITSPTFAFPYGTKSLGFSGGALAEVARRSGVRCALTTEDELVRIDGDPFDWGRFTAHQHDTAATLAVKLDGWFTYARRLWNGKRSAGSEHSEPEPALAAGGVE